MSIKLGGTVIIREDFIYIIRKSIFLYFKRKKNSNGEMKLLSSRLYFQLVTPRQIGSASCQNFSHIQVKCDIVYSIHRLSQSYHSTHGKKSTVHGIRIFVIKRLYHIFIYIFFRNMLQINRFQQT